jgi:hypothetical protein
MSDKQAPPPPGYYDDGTGQQRYWDGQQWADALATASVQTGASVGQTADQKYGHGPDPATGYTPIPTAPYPTPQTVRQTNVLGVVALCVAGIGFIFACIPGALVVGWVLLPIGFILAIVALFLKGKGKALALTALIVSVVGTVVGFVVFFAVVANSFTEAFGGTGSSVTQPSSSSAAKSPKTESGSSQVGSRGNPAAVGAQIKSNDYTITINSVNLNDTDAVMAANEFNDQPDSGTAYALINATVTYTGKDTGNTSFIDIAYVTASGNVINSYDKLVVGPDPELGGQELYPGASATGNLVLQVPIGDDGLIRVRPGVIADELFVKTK